VVGWDMRPLLEPSSIARMMDERICRTCENVNWQGGIRNSFYGARAPSVSKPPHYRGFTITVTAHSVGLFWTSADTSTWQHTTLTPCPQRDSNTQSWQARGSNSRLRPRAHWNRPEIWNIRNISCPRATSSNKKPNSNCRTINTELREETSATNRRSKVQCKAKLQTYYTVNNLCC
jgi:hypothetical protein